MYAHVLPYMRACACVMSVHSVIDHPTLGEPEVPPFALLCFALLCFALLRLRKRLLGQRLLDAILNRRRVFQGDSLTLPE